MPNQGRLYFAVLLIASAVIACMLSALAGQDVYQMTAAVVAAVLNAVAIGFIISYLEDTDRHIQKLDRQAQAEQRRRLQ